MVPLARIASLAKTFGGAYRRAVTRRTGMAEAEPSVRPHDNRATRSDGGRPVVSFRLVEISLRAVGSPPQASSERGQLPARRDLQLGEWSRSPASGFTLVEMMV